MKVNRKNAGYELQRKANVAYGTWMKFDTLKTEEEALIWLERVTTDKDLGAYKFRVVKKEILTATSD